MRRDFFPSLRTGAAVASALGMLVACTSSTHGGTGVVTGLAPICYGPGPNTNLHPVTVIRAVRADGFSRAVKVHTADHHHTYRLTLPAGHYKISTYSGHVAVTVHLNAITPHVDLPQPACY
jgi:hypothetical protein